MKKFLSLVLALVMTMSLVTISAGASFTDDSKVNYDEAVDVISALGIVGGYPDGSFKPQGSLTRGAAAKIICNMMLGVKTAAELPSVASYSDVPAGSTYAPYIAYLKNEGVISGYADGTFRPGVTLTGYHFLKMLLGAMGYDAQVEGLVGDGWQINVAKLAKQAKLYDGNKNFKGNEPATREQACLYALNTMMAGTVKYDNQSSITIGDIVIQNNSKAEPTGECFYETNFDSLVKTVNSSDEMGRPGTKWEYGTGADYKNIGVYGDEAKYTFVADKTWTDSVLTAIRKATDKKTLVDAAANNCYYTNRDAGVTTPLSAISKATLAGGNVNAGDKVEVFVNSANTNQISRVVVTHYVLGEITKVDTNITNKQDIEDGVTAKVTVKVAGATKTYKDTVFAGFDADTYVKGAKVLVATGKVDSVDKILDSEIAKTVSGKIESVKGSKVTIDGTTYTALAGASLSTSDLNKEGTFVLDKANNILSADLTSVGTVDNYLFVYGVDRADATVNEDGVRVNYTYTVYGVNAAGEKVSYPVKDEYTINNLFYTGGGDTNYKVVDDTKTLVVPYEMDGKYMKIDQTPAAGWKVFFGTTPLGKTATNAAATAKVTVTGSGDTAYYAGNDTQFIFKSVKDNAVKVTTAVGYKNVNIKANEYYIVTKDSDIKAVFSFAKDAGAKADEVYKLAVCMDSNATQTKDSDNKTYYTYDVVIDGVETTVTMKSDDHSALTAGKVYKLTVDGDYVKTPVELDTVTISKVAADDTYFYAGSAVYELNDDATVYTVYENWKSAGGTAVFDNYVVNDDTVLEKDIVVHAFKDSDNNYTFFFHKSNKADFVVTP